MAEFKRRYAQVIVDSSAVAIRKARIADVCHVLPFCRCTQIDPTCCGAHRRLWRLRSYVVAGRGAGSSRAEKRVALDSLPCTPVSCPSRKPESMVRSAGSPPY
jgi:hypothetical protein